MPWFAEKSPQITPERMQELIGRTVEECRQRICKNPKRVLLLPPDITRMHSGAAGSRSALQRLQGRGRRARDPHARPARAAHAAKKTGRCSARSRNERIHPHDWRGGCVPSATIPAEVRAGIVRRQSPIGRFPIWLNSMLMEEKWDLVINIGHVVPHEVLGFANHNKNYFIGLGGKDLICAAHMMAAVLRHREQPGQPAHARAAVLQLGRGEVPRHAARLLRAGRAGPRPARTSSCTPASSSATIWRPTCRRPAVPRAEHHDASTSRCRKSSA